MYIYIMTFESIFGKRTSGEEREESTTSEKWNATFAFWEILEETKSEPNIL